MTLEERKRRRFSEEFRKEQVRLIENGHRTIAEVSRLFEVKRSSVKGWLNKYGTSELPGQVVIQTQAEVNRIKELEKQTLHLKQVIGEQQVELLYLRECLSLARERLGGDFEKKNQREVVRRLSGKREEIGLVMESLYSHLGITRQGHHQRLRSWQAELDLMQSIEEQVTQYRADLDRRAGSRSLFYNLEIKSQFGIGITKFEQLMSEYGLTLAPLRVLVITTQSVLQSWNYENLTNGLKINGINQVVVGDLTYVSIGLLRFYLFCLTDVYSARLVGLWGSNRMRAVDAEQAFNAWVELRGKENIKGCIHHTDGGGQYFSNLYLKQMKDHFLQISVARNCLENGFAEQRNGLIKHHLIPTMRLQNLGQFQSELQNIDYFYNYQRKQERLNWQTPVQFEQYIESLDPKDRPVKILHDFGYAPKSGMGF